MVASPAQNEMDEVPFFDVQLPYELAINIFQYLNRRELGRCAQVSKTWKVIAEDEVLWYRLCQQEGHLPRSSISDYSCWKLILQECRAKEHMLRANWKNRKGAVSELEHVPDAVLCDVRSHDGVVIAGIPSDLQLSCEVWFSELPMAESFTSCLRTGGDQVCYIILTSEFYLSDKKVAMLRLKYTSGDVRVWDTRTWDYVAPFLESESEEEEPGMQPYVSFVRINSSLAVAAYEDDVFVCTLFEFLLSKRALLLSQHSLELSVFSAGILNIWDLRTGKFPIHRFEHDARIQALALSREEATVATASAFDVVMLYPNEEGYWHVAAEFEVQKLVDYLEIVPDTGRYPVAIATAGDLVYLLKAEDSARTLHYVYGQPATCLDVSASQVAFGVKSLGWVYEGNKTPVVKFVEVAVTEWQATVEETKEKCLDHITSYCSATLLRLTSIDTSEKVAVDVTAHSSEDFSPFALEGQILVYSLEAERCLSKLGNALGDFTCVNLRDSPPNLMVSGNMDRRVRLHDLRSDKIALSLSAHQLGVSAVQMDDWKIVSGGEEGLVSVWDYRMNQKLWEVHSRHPVRHVSFNSHSLITANVPYEKVVRNSDLDNFACHRRHRGLIHAYEFAVDQLAFQSPLPVCRSPCDTMAGYSYDLALSFPYDSV
ncbi:hypothetical protein A6R68_20483 [Neotoma lepida]|uniref:F-box domain-containing protein n=1 Tax=Neotoma lepida TaxID=56216 RepID=A0A1A6HSS9_NEOLE|nr:hypothetical protein A6R68_20483 [Neotoma lepida]